MLTKKQTNRVGARHGRVTLAVLLAGLLLSQVAAAKVVYRWKNDAGRYEVSHSIPADVVHKGYEILDGATMNIIKIVPPQMSTEEYAAQLERERRKAKCDRTLDRLYSLYEDEDDIVKAEATALKQLDVRTENARQDLRLARKSLSDLESAAARSERKGEKVQDNVLEDLTRANSQIATLERELKQREEERARMQSDYDLERRMFNANSCEVEGYEVYLAGARTD
jgi:hypothetical protein